MLQTEQGVISDDGMIDDIYLIALADVRLSICFSIYLSVVAHLHLSLEFFF